MIGFGVPDCRPSIPPVPFALMRHALPDGTHHFDLLLAASPQVADEAREVATWRCDVDPWTLPIGGVAIVQRIAPHRGLYLRLAAPRELGGDRGQVTPVRGGTYTMRDGIIETMDDARTCLRMVGDRLQRVAAPLT